MIKLKRRRRRDTQVYATEKPSIFIILGLLVVAVGLLIYFFNPYNQVTSPLPPQPESILSKYHVSGLPEIPGTNSPAATSPAPAPQAAAPAPAPSAVPAPAPTPPQAASSAPAPEAHALPPLSTSEVPPETNAVSPVPPPSSGETK